MPSFAGHRVADHISAVDNATNAYVAGLARDACAPWIVDAGHGAVDFAAVRAPYLHPSRQYVVVALLTSGWRRRAAPRKPHPFAARAFEEAMREEDVSTQQPQAQQEARVSPADADKGRSRGAAQSPVQGPLAPVGLIWPVRERSTFRALAQSRRRRRGVVMVSSTIVGPSTEPPRVAYAVGRGVGGAVARNRVRRRLRAATRAHVQELMPGRAYLVGATASAVTASYSDLSTSLHDALCALREDLR